MVGLGLLIYLLLGPTVISAWIAGTLLPVICTIAFLACCELQDGRLAFYPGYRRIGYLDL